MKKLNKINGPAKSELITWQICRAALLIWGVWGFLHGYTSELIQAAFAIIFTHLWDFFQMFASETNFIRKYPSYIQTMLNVFICLACVVGTTLNTRTEFRGIDIPEHIFAGYLSCTGAYVLSEIVQGEKHPIKISVQAMFSMGCSVALLVGWEFYEFTMDRLYCFVMQHGQVPYSYGLTDTVLDLIWGCLGTFTAMFIEAFRRVGLIGKNKKEKREKYLSERAQFKKEKEQLHKSQQHIQ